MVHILQVDEGCCGPDCRRTNGLRDDAAKFLADTAPTFLRFPGGNNIEGLSIPQRWIWNNTIGPVVDRPGRQGNTSSWILGTKLDANSHR